MIVADRRDYPISCPRITKDRYLTFVDLLLPNIIYDPYYTFRQVWTGQPMN